MFALHSSPSPFSHLSLSFIVLKDMLYHTWLSGPTWVEVSYKVREVSSKWESRRGSQGVNGSTKLCGSHLNSQKSVGVRRKSLSTQEYPEDYQTLTTFIIAYYSYLLLLITNNNNPLETRVTAASKD